MSERLLTKDSVIVALEKELRDLKVEATTSLQQVRIVENECNTLVKLLEEERRSAIQIELC